MVLFIIMLVNWKVELFEIISYRTVPSTDQEYKRVPAIC